MNKITIPICILLIILFSACTADTVTVVVHSQKNAAQILPGSMLIIDDTMRINLSDSSTAVLQLTPGLHSFSYRNGIRQSFGVDPKGGLLNVDSSEYVLFPITYQFESGADNYNNSRMIDLTSSNVIIPSAIVVDTFVVIKDYTKRLNDSTILKMAMLKESDEVPKNAMERILYFNEQGIQKIGKNQLFLPKTWDYHITDSIPAQIEEMVSADVSKKNTDKKAMLPAEMFLLIAQMDTVSYKVLSLNKVKAGAAREMEEGKVSGAYKN